MHVYAEKILTLRTVSIFGGATALEEARLLRLRHDARFELTLNSVEVLGGILRNIGMPLRARVQELNEMRRGNTQAALGSVR